MNWRYWTTGLLLTLGLLCSWPITRLALPPIAQNSTANISVMIVSLGGARGILSEILWWRINSLQREGRNAEIYPLTQLLTQLDPATPNIAIFHAWNCSYNIASTYSDPNDCWLWMKRGHQILEEELKRYPEDKMILREMTAFWLLKFYGNLDPNQSFYCQHVAEIPMAPELRATLRAQGLPEDTNVPALRLYAWAHRAKFSFEECFAIEQLLRMTPHSNVAHKAFADAYRFACQNQELSENEIHKYQNIARERLLRFPNDPNLKSILKETL